MFEINNFILVFSFLVVYICIPYVVLSFLSTTHIHAWCAIAVAHSRKGQARLLEVAGVKAAPTGASR